MLTNTKKMSLGLLLVFLILGQRVQADNFVDSEVELYRKAFEEARVPTPADLALFKPGHIWQCTRRTAWSSFMLKITRDTPRDFELFKPAVLQVQYQFANSLERAPRRVSSDLVLANSVTVNKPDFVMPNTELYIPEATASHILFHVGTAQGHLPSDDNSDRNRHTHASYLRITADGRLVVEGVIRAEGDGFTEEPITSLNEHSYAYLSPYRVWYYDSCTATE